MDNVSGIAVTLCLSWAQEKTWKTLKVKGKSWPRRGALYEVFCTVLLLQLFIDEWGNDRAKVYYLCVIWSNCFWTLSAVSLHPCYLATHGGPQWACLYPQPADKVTFSYFKTCGVGVPALSVTPGSDWTQKYFSLHLWNIKIFVLIPSLSPH